MAAARTTTGQDDLPAGVWTDLERLRCPGLTQEAPEFHSLKSQLPPLYALMQYKKMNSDAWLLFVGGTGTGKSTLFNALCQSPISLTGVERPMTGGPVAYAHKDLLNADNLPLKGIEIIKAVSSQTLSGKTGHLTVWTHEKNEWRHLAIVDTPDLDSVEVANRRMTEDLLGLADFIVFVSSEEKYADEIPNAVLSRILKSPKPCFFLLNKVRDHHSGGEVIRTLRGFGIELPEKQTWLIPYIPSPRPERIEDDPAFREFTKDLLSSTSGEPFRKTRLRETDFLLGRLRSESARLAHLLSEEERVSRWWLQRLQETSRTLEAELTEALKSKHVQDTREYLGQKVRELFTRYDVLAGPRRIFREILFTPFRMIGLGRKRRPGFSKEALARIRKTADYGPVLRAIEKFHIRVLQELSPADRSSSLYAALREEGLALGNDEVQNSLGHAFDELDAWLERTFQDLAGGISTTRKWGIYSTSILWGLLIISMEVAVGGGFSILDAAIDSAIAPFVTRGAVEVFAAQEIRKIARELGQRYQSAVSAPLREQHLRYADCLRSLLPPPESTAALKALQTSASHEIGKRPGETR